MGIFVYLAIRNVTVPKKRTILVSAAGFCIGSKWNPWLWPFNHELNPGLRITTPLT